MTPSPNTRELSAALAERTELREIVEAVVRMLAARPGMAHPYLALADPTTGEVRIEEASGPTDEPVRERRHRHRYRFAEGIVGRVIASGRTRVVHGSGMSFICAPVRLGEGGEVVGVLAVDRRAPEPQELRRDVELVTVVASIVASMLGQALLAANTSVPDEDATALPDVGLDEALDGLERRMLQAALEASGGNRAAAARALGISERRMGLRARKYRL